MSNTKKIEEAILAALQSAGEQQTANHAYFKFLKATLYMPVEKNSPQDDPKVLFLEDGDHIFLPVFSQENFLKDWAGEHYDQIDNFQLTGIDLLKGLGLNVTIAFNPGQESYKEFNPEEIEKLKTMVVKIQNLMDK